MLFSRPLRPSLDNLGMPRSRVRWEPLSLRAALDGGGLSMALHSGELFKVPPCAPAGASRLHGPTLADLRLAGSCFRWRSLFLDEGPDGGLDDEAGPCPCDQRRILVTGPSALL